MALPDVSRVAVIGAGVSGVCTAAHLLEHGIKVTVFERTDCAGGVWHFDEQAAEDPAYPNEIPSSGDYAKVDFEDDAYLTPPRTPDEGNDKQTKHHQIVRTVHAPPGACYAGLKNNVPLSLMKNSLADWPIGLEEFVSQVHLEEYIQHISKSTGVEASTLYSTRVEQVQKLGNSWQLQTTTRSNGNRLVPRTWTFDAVVVASGHYHMPRIPDIPGLKQWKDTFPDRVSHSKGYRRAADFKDQTVLLIGAGTSSSDIAKELGAVAKHVYQSSRGGQYDFPASSLPANGTRIGGIQGFELDSTYTSVDKPVPGKILLRNGQRLCNIDRVILCTGYVTSYPFLSQYHDDKRPPDAADERVLVTAEGNMVHNLHKDIFYIVDPSLAFVGVPYHTATFSLFDFQAQLVARVFAKVAPFPSVLEMRQTYNERIRLKGRGRDFHSLRQTGAETAYVDSLVAWANEDLSDGTAPMLGHSDQWRTTYAAFRKLVEERIGLRLTEAAGTPNKYDSIRLEGVNVC